jgi:predicted permease
MLTDFRHSFRALLKTPSFTATALATLALCLGANLTIFAVVDAILIRPLPYPASDRLVTLYYIYPKLPSATTGASLTNYYERKGKIPALGSLSEIQEGTSVIGEAGASSIENLGRVTPEFFATLGITPFMGRGFKEAEMTYQSDHVAMISYDYWRNHYNSDPSILGKAVRLDGMPRVIVGVLPPDFRFLSFQAPVFMPLSSEEGERNVGARHSIGKILFGRLAPGASLAEAQGQVDALDTAIAPTFPEAKIVAEAGCRTVVASLHADHVAAVRPVLLLLQAGALFLLVIGGVNLANLLLIRASGRSRDLAIRRALGAGQRHVIREVMMETILLTVLGGLFGLLVGAFGIDLVGALSADQLPLGARIGFNSRIASLAMAGALATGIVLSAPIIWFNLRSRLAPALQSESRGSTVSRTTRRLRGGFIIAQIALAFMLLTGAGLLGLSLKRAMSVSPGFRADHVITGGFNLTWAGYHDLNAFQLFFDRLGEKGATLPGVTALGAASNVPVSGRVDGNAMFVPNYGPEPGETVLVHNQVAVVGDYFAAMGIPLLAGRYLDKSDMPFERKTCVVDENFARHYWPEGAAVGRQIYRSTNHGPDEKPYTIVGVVGAVKQTGLTEMNSSGSVYFAYTQLFRRNFYLAARTSLPPETLGATLTKVIRDLDPEVPLNDLRSMEIRIDDSLATRRSPALLAGIFAGTALLLASIGLYGAMAYTVAQRTTEFGIRMALGAQQGDVLRMVFGQGARLAALGLGVGVVGALLLSGTMSSLLFDVKANDPLALAGVAGLLAAVAAFACWIPARRATKVDPMVALRAE